MPPTSRSWVQIIILLPVLPSLRGLHGTEKEKMWVSMVTITFALDEEITLGTENIGV